MIGTVLRFGATMTSAKPYALPRLRAYAREAIDSLGLGFRRFAVEKYPKFKNAYTLIAFLNESHLELTTYPEDNVIELEVASCRSVCLEDFLHWTASIKDLKVVSSFVLRKDELGNWNKEHWLSR